MPMYVRPAQPPDRDWMKDLFLTRWGATNVLLRGRLWNALVLPALIAEDASQRCGVATYDVRAAGAAGAVECELITLDAIPPRQGIGTALIAAVADLARQRGAGRLVVVTTNDNLGALRFYQRRGFVLVEVRPGAIERYRHLKPAIPAVGEFGIAIRDEIELERRLQVQSQNFKAGDSEGV
jgi:GNAT superfamily N-acetyltransferase